MLCVDTVLSQHSQTCIYFVVMWWNGGILLPLEDWRFQFPKNTFWGYRNQFPVGIPFSTMSSKMCIIFVVMWWCEVGWVGDRLLWKIGVSLTCLQTCPQYNIFVFIYLPIFSENFYRHIWSNMAKYYKIWQNLWPQFKTKMST